jgi:hypothetical protein
MQRNWIGRSEVRRHCMTACRSWCSIAYWASTCMVLVWQLC